MQAALEDAVAEAQQLVAENELQGPAEERGQCVEPVREDADRPPPRRASPGPRTCLRKASTRCWPGPCPRPVSRGLEAQVTTPSPGPSNI